MKINRDGYGLSTLPQKETDPVWMTRDLQHTTNDDLIVTLVKLLELSKMQKESQSKTKYSWKQN